MIKRLADERNQILRGSGLNPDRDWRGDLSKLAPSDRSRVKRALFAAWDDQLDIGAGECLLSRPKLSLIVANSLLSFNGVRYELTDFVIMPNHVHLLVAFRDENMLLKQCSSWKRFTAREINTALARRGHFWQVEQFDHLVRNEEELQHYRHYIAENPRRARLPLESFRHYSKPIK